MNDPSFITVTEASTQLSNRFKVVVELVIEADCGDDAEADVNNILREGMLAMLDNEEREPVHEYDITEINPAEL